MTVRAAALAAALALASAPPLAAQTSPPPAGGETSAPARGPSAGKLLDAASKKAQKAKKNLFVGFHASWCGYCKKFEKALAEPGVKEIFEENYEVVWLTVLERALQKKLENPGAWDLMGRLGGQEAGLPFFAILSPDGNVLITSIRPATLRSHPGNIGLPSTEDNIAHFVEMLKSTSKKFGPADEAAVRKAFGS